MQYDRSVHTYSPDGRIFQIEYAMKAMNHGTTTLGFTTKDSVIIISEKKIVSKLQIKESLSKHFRLVDNIGYAFSGITGDAKTILEIARRISLDHLKTYKENISVVALLKHICNISLQFSESEYHKKIFGRPFGASIMLGSVEGGVPLLYLLDPSGSYNPHSAKAIGSAHETLEEELKSKFESMKSNDETLRDGLALLANVMKDKINEDNVEIMVIREDGVHFMQPTHIKEYL